MSVLTPRQDYAVSTAASWYPVTLVNGANVAIAGMAGQRICVYAVFLSASSSVNITLQDGSNAFTGAMPMTGLAFDTEDKPFICSTSNNFVITSTGSAAGSVFAKFST
jgi:hypothetical protein